MPRPAVPDEDLVRALYEQYGPALLGYVTGLVGGDRQRAEDIVQETVLRAWRHPDVLAPDNGRSPRAWLFTVARNLVIDAHRARSSRPPESYDEGLEVSGGDGGIGAVLTRYELIEAIDSLAPAHREVIVTLFYLDHSVAEASRLLGVPEGTVKSRSHYALRALRNLCQERGLLP